MSAYTDASLIMVPSGYKDGKLYSAKPTNGDGDFTFSRGTEATRVNSAGLIEKARTNRLLQSNNFNTTWGTGFSTLTSGQVGYDGTNDAWKIESTTIGGETRIRQSQTFTTGEVISLSVYMKKGNVNFGIVRTYAITGGGRAWFDLENGTVATENSGINGSIKDVGNGWYRCSIWGVITTTGAVDIAPAPADGDYLADAVGEFIYIQDSQLESGLVATEYIETTTSSVTVGITDDLPRVDYSGGGCPSLLLEPSRTNLYTHSEYFDTYTQANLTISTNATTSLEGLQNASKLVSSSGVSIKRIQPTITTSSATDYIISAFVKKAEWDYFFIYGDGTLSSGQQGIWDLENGTITQGSGHSTIESFGEGWYKITWKATASGAGSASPRIGITDNSTGVNSTGDGTSGVFLYGLQIEEGSYSTSLIPTYGASVTRGADTSINYDNGNLPTAYPFTLYAEIDVIDTNSGNVFSFLDSSQSSFYYTIEYFSNAWHITSRPSGSTSRVSSTTAITSGTHKLLGIYTGTTMTLYLDGTLIASGSNTQSFNTNINDLLLGQLRVVSDTGNRNSIKEAIVFNTELSSDEAIQLTTI